MHRAIDGFGAASRIHTAGLLDLPSDLPLFVEIVDSTEYIGRFLPTLLDLVGDGMATCETVEVAHSGKPRKDLQAADSGAGSGGGRQD